MLCQPAGAPCMWLPGWCFGLISGGVFDQNVLAFIFCAIKAAALYRFLSDERKAPSMSEVLGSVCSDGHKVLPWALGMHSVQQRFVQTQSKYSVAI